MKRMTPIVVQATKTGVSHEVIGGTNQDSSAYWCDDKSRIAIIALADGVGSVKYAKQGASLAVNTVRREADRMAKNIRERLGYRLTQSNELKLAIDAKKLCYKLLDHAQKKILRFANVDKYRKESAPKPEDAFATTLMISILTDQWCSVLQVGDGFCIARAHDSNQDIPLALPVRIGLEQLVWPITFGPLSELETRDAISYRFLQIDRPSLFCSTDGLMDLALEMPSMIPHSAFFDPFFTYLSSSEYKYSTQHQRKQPLCEFLSSQAVRRRTHDDLTIVMAATN